MTDILQQVKHFKTELSREAEDLITNVFPKKILELRDFYDRMKERQPSSVQSELNIPFPDPELLSERPQTKKRKLSRADRGEGASAASGSRVLLFPNGVVPVNSNIHQLCNELKPFTHDLMMHANIIKTWITLLIPKIEDGNNFGVSIQEEAMLEASVVETKASIYLEKVVKYFLIRAKLISKVAKYPHVCDFRQAVLELDEKAFLSLKLACCELRNAYATLQDVILKNMEKIKKPRNANTEGMY